MEQVDVWELRRRSVVKSLLWRFIGIIWTWVGAYLILLLTPDKHKTASLMATLIVMYHHSTRMIMYYFYERVWSSVNWGKINSQCRARMSMSVRDCLNWTLIVLAALAVLFFFILYITPVLKS